MKDGYSPIGLDEKHEKVHRSAFNSPETIYITQQIVPTVDNMKLGEPRIYNDNGTYYLYIKVSKTDLVRKEMDSV